MWVSLCHLKLPALDLCSLFHCCHVGEALREAKQYMEVVKYFQMWQFSIATTVGALGRQSVGS